MSTTPSPACASFCIGDQACAAKSNDDSGVANVIQHLKGTVLAPLFFARKCTTYGRREVMAYRARVRPLTQFRIRATFKFQLAPREVEQGEIVAFFFAENSTKAVEILRAAFPNCSICEMESIGSFRA